MPFLGHIGGFSSTATSTPLKQFLVVFALKQALVRALTKKAKTPKRAALVPLLSAVLVLVLDCMY